MVVVVSVSATRPVDVFFFLQRGFTHWVPFCEWGGVPVSGGLSAGRLLSMKAPLIHGLLLAALAGGCAKPSAPPPPPLDPAQKGKIQAGIGVEEARLNMTQAEVEKIWGKPEAVDKFSKSQVFLSYYQKGIEVALDDGKVGVITCHAQDDQWKAYPGATAEGLWVGSPRAQFEATLKGGSSFSEALKYPNLGLWIRFTDKGATSTISVIKLEK